ncbi:MAG: alpha/beta hydrolase [Verrucomicrobiota bacterium]
MNVPTIEEFLLAAPGSGEAPAAPQEEVVLFYPYAHDERGFHRVFLHTKVPTLTIYRPDRENDRRTAFVVCPGGGYRGIVIDREGHAFGRYFQRRGYTVAVLKYRLPAPAWQDAAEQPAALQDAMAAVRLLRSRAPDWDINPGKIGILGCSAGGHLAGSAAMLWGKDLEARPDFAALLYPVVCMHGSAAHAESRENLLGPSPSPERAAAFSLELQARPGLPPFFIAHAKDDQTVSAENSRLLASALLAADVPVRIALYETGGHGFALGKGPPTDGWMPSFTQWLDELP